MKVLTVQEVNDVCGAGNVEICQVGTTVAGGIIGGVAGFYGGLGFGAGAGASWGATVGGMAGTLFCPIFF